MADCMTFPGDIFEFIKSYSFKDTDEIYTNGAELISVLRVRQMLEHYFAFPRGWISVKDRLPEQSGEVFVYTENHHTASVSYSKKYNAFNWFDVLGEVRGRDGGALWNVKYWMPIPQLPEPPEAPHDAP